MTQQQIELGSTVVMHFTLKLSDNSVAETTKKTQPSRFTLTMASLHDPVESALIGKRAGDRVRIPLSVEQGYGPVLEENKHQLERGRFPIDVELQVGDIYNFDQPNGASIPGVIAAIGEERVVVDFNHPLAGQVLLCEIEVLQVEAPTQ